MGQIIEVEWSVACLIPFNRAQQERLARAFGPFYDEGMELVVYSTSWCRDCREAKRFLEDHNIPYTEIDIESDPQAAVELVHKVGKRAIPQFVIDGEWVQPYRPGEGFLYEEMSELLGVM